MGILSKKIVNRLVTENYIDSSVSEAYVYCFDFIIENLKYDFTISTIGIILDCFDITIIYIVIFNILRNLTGGYHANTPLLCNLLSYLTYVLLIGLSYVVPIFPIQLYPILFLLGATIIKLSAPVTNQNKLHFPDTNATKKKITKYLFISLIFLFICYYKGAYLYCYTLTYSICTIAISLLIQLCINRRRKIHDI